MGSQSQVQRRIQRGEKMDIEELKTLKDIIGENKDVTVVGDNKFAENKSFHNDSLNEVERDLRQEAIKWIKELERHGRKEI